MKKIAMMLAVVVLSVNVVSAAVVTTDTFGSGASQFDIDFVTISGDSGNLGSWLAGYDYTFSGVNHGDYRMGRLEISNDHWNKYVSSTAGTERPAVYISWFDAAHFVNYLNTSTGNQAAYKFTADVMGVWQDGDDGYDASNPYRNSNAKYFMPTEDEWVKAAYWNGMNLQTYATTNGSLPIAGANTNYHSAVGQTWDVGSGSEELNGTYDMMGNVWEWMESSNSGEFSVGSPRVIRGGSFGNDDDFLSSSWSEYAQYDPPSNETGLIGFRVASNVPEPCSLVLLGLGGVMLRRRRRA